MLSMGQAATEAGISKSTLSRAIKIGRVSAIRNDQGGYSIDPAELFRVYPRNGATPFDNGSMKRDATPAPAPDATPALKAEIEGLRAQLALMREQTDELKAQRDDMKEQRDTWQRQAEASQRLLADQRPVATKGFFGWLRAS